MTLNSYKQCLKLAYYNNICYNSKERKFHYNKKKGKVHMIFRIIINLLCGALSGWLAGKIMNSSNSLIINIILGVVGGVVGSIVLGLIGIGANGFIGGIVVSVLGACLLIWLSRKFLK